MNTNTKIKNIPLASRFINWLRGDYNSIRFRFYRLPLQTLNYWWARIRGKSYTEWYANRMDGEAAQTKNRPLSQRYLETASIQLDYLKARGLQPHHQFLEYGAGVLRAGILFIDYLQPEKYTGADISRLRLEKGIVLATERGLARDRYRIEVLSSAEAKELGDTKFDYVLSHDVFCHMPLSECKACLVALRKNLAADGKLFITFSRADNYRTWKLKDFWFTEAQFREMCESAGWKYEAQKDWEQYRVPESDDQAMVLLTRL